jgi:formylglycine-generating enzyme required for sulfatase activity
MRTTLSQFCNAPKEGHDGHPMNCVDQSAAAGYCAWEGGRLPDEAEWEYAARGASSQRFPWGSKAPSPEASELCWDRRKTGLGTCGVGQFPAGASPAGALDMAGNVWEWTSSAFSPERKDARVCRGGSWPDPRALDFRGAYRDAHAPTNRDSDLGFRCVREATAKPDGG